MILAKTASVCPVCLRQIAAERVLYGNDVYLKKECAEHGRFSTVVWRGVGDEFANWLNDTAKTENAPAPQCPTDCDGCTSHLTRTCCALIEITSRCNLKCPICFAEANGEIAQDITRDTQKPKNGNSAIEPSLTELEASFRMLVEGGNTFVQLSGGEPTMREDLPEIIVAARRCGVETVQLNSNGLRLAREPGYAQSLANAGLAFVFLQFDGVTDAPYEVLRGASLLAEKLRAIEFCGKAGLGVTLVPTLVPGVNDGEIGAILELATRMSPVVRGVHFQPISYFGRYPTPPSNEQRITLPEVLREIELQTQGKFKLRDFNPSSCDHPRCGFHGDFVIMPKERLMKLTKKYDPNASCCEDAHLKNRNFVARRWTRDDEAERESAIEKDEVTAENHSAPELSAFLRRVKSHGFTVSAMAFQDAYTLDLERLVRCSLSVVRADRLVPFCANYLTAAQPQGIPSTYSGTGAIVQIPQQKPKKRRLKARIMRVVKHYHPGGINLTERGIRLAGLREGMRVLDIGCGDGVTVELLRSMGIDAVGLDIDPYNPSAADYIVRGDALALPFSSGEFDAVIFECSLSVITDAIAALREAERVVRPRGVLMMSDIFAKKMAPGLPWITDDIRKILKWAGFGITIAEDHTPALVTYAAEAIANGERFCDGIDARQLGYCLVVAEKYN